MTARDVRLARRITEIAAAEEVRADPACLQVLELALDTADAAAVKPFWRAVLGLADSAHSDLELVDPDGSLPTLWFQPTAPHDEPRQRFHVDVRVPPEVAPGGSRRPSAPAAAWSATSGRRCSGCSPTPRATRRA